MKNFLVRLLKVAALSSAAVLAGVVTLFVGLIVLMAVSLSISSSADSIIAEQEFVYGDENSKNKLLQIDVNGLILGEPEELGDFFGGFETGITYGYEVKDQLLAAAKDEDIDGILLYVNSPGGTIYGSKAIADGVSEYRSKTSKPVLGFVGGMAASGGYWAVSAADQIVADAGTMMGSIGVIYGPFKFYDSVISEDGGLLVGGVVTQNGIESTYISAGKSKDLGNPYRPMTAEEQAMMQRMVNDSYTDFVASVAVNRQIEPRVVTDQIGAFVFSEHAAEQNGLIDGATSKHGAYEKLGDMANLGNDFKVLRLYREPGILQSLMQARFGSINPQRTTQACPLVSLPLALHGDVMTACGW